jgi:purine nucleoside permease
VARYLGQEVENMPSTELETRLSRLQMWVSTGLLFVVLSVLSLSAVTFWQASRIGQNQGELRQVATETHSALCALKLDIQIRKDALVKIIRDNPEGILGIDRKALDQALENYRRTLAALSILDCA